MCSPPPTRSREQAECRTPAHLFSGAFTCDHAGAARNNATHRARPARRLHSQPATRPRPGARSLVRTRWAVPSGDARLRSPKGALRAPSSRTCSLDASVSIPSLRCASLGEHFATPPRRHPPHPTALARPPGHPQTMVTAACYGCGTRQDTSFSPRFRRTYRGRVSALPLRPSATDWGRPPREGSRGNAITLGCAWLARARSDGERTT